MARRRPRSPCSLPPDDRPAAQEAEAAGGVDRAERDDVPPRCAEPRGRYPRPRERGARRPADDGPLPPGREGARLVVALDDRGLPELVVADAEPRIDAPPDAPQRQE